MSNQIKNTCKGVMLGMLAGMAAAAIGLWCLKNNRRGIRKNIGKALHSIGNLVDNVTNMF
ncbi:MAG: hypothetical protein IKI50_02080 [Clostridia bacterium]|nr:hypothetical protein [Clostridia bacterium]